jgi:hypothetical protein
MPRPPRAPRPHIRGRAASRTPLEDPSLRPIGQPSKSSAAAVKASSGSLRIEACGTELTRSRHSPPIHLVADQTDAWIVGYGPRSGHPEKDRARGGRRGTRRPPADSRVSRVARDAETRVPSEFREARESETHWICGRRGLCVAAKVAGPAVPPLATVNLKYTPTAIL